jgi:hypothetical protein
LRSTLSFLLSPTKRVIDRRSCARERSASWIIVSFIALCIGTGGCSLFHQDLPNDPPVISTQADTLRVKRDGSITLNVVASDEDDDPLFYVWSATGGTLDQSGSRAEWIAPGQIEGASQIFTVRVTVLDRECDLIADAQDRFNCENTAFASVDSFRIEVVQTPPSLQSITHEESPSFRQPTVSLSAFASDEEDDLLSFVWSAEDSSRTAVVDSVGSEVNVIPLFPGQHVIVVAVNDRADTVMGSATIEVASAVVPEGGSVQLELPATSQSPVRFFEIDVFEYPNQRGTMPLLVDSFFEAAQICSEAGARLCTDQEWLMACAGEENSSFSSVDDPDELPAQFGRRFCNTTGSELNASTAENGVGALAGSGSFPNCSSFSGVYDLTGNAREWLVGLDSTQTANRSQSSAVQRATCDDIIALPPVASPAEDSDLRYFEPGSGFRCCHDLEVVDAVGKKIGAPVHMNP